MYSNMVVMGFLFLDFHPRLVGLTGTPQQVQKTSRAFRVYSSSSQHNEDDEDYLVDHSIFLYLMDKEGRLVAYYGTDLDAETVASKMAASISQLEGTQSQGGILDQLKSLLFA